MVVIHSLGTTLGMQGIDWGWQLVPSIALLQVVCIGIIEEVATLELHLVLTSPSIRVVQTNRIDQRNTILLVYHILTKATTATTTATATAGHAQDILEREILLVDVIKQTDK